MLGFETYWEPVAIGTDALIAYLLYKAYKSYGRDAKLLSGTATYEVGPELQLAVEGAPGKALDYVCIRGLTEAKGEPLKSSFTDGVGVVQHLLHVEHKSSRIRDYWSDYKNTICDIFNFRPFFIVTPEPTTMDDLATLDNRCRVEVTDILHANYLKDHLPTVHNNYRPAKDNVFATSLERIFGDVTKGYQDTEKLLGLGVPVLGVGRVTFDGKKLILQPPCDGRRFIVTTLSKLDVIRAMKSKSSTIKVFLWIFVVMGTGLVGYSLYRFVQRRLVMEELRRWRATDSAGDAASGENTGTCCVICLTNRRNVIVLNCGHSCMCVACAQALPEPKKCPICRGNVVRFVAIY